MTDSVIPQSSFLSTDNYPSASLDKALFKIKREDFKFTHRDNHLHALVVASSFALTILFGTKYFSSKSERTRHFTRFWPALGFLSGTTIGILANFWQNRSVHADGSAICDILEQPLLQTINSAKELETKRAIYLTSLAIALLTICGKIYDCKISDPSKALSRLSTQIRKFPWVETITTGALILIGQSVNELNNHYLKKPYGFDLSGHILLKGVTTYGLISAIDYTKRVGLKKAGIVAGMIAGITEAIFLAKTTGCHHTVAESVGGFALGMGLFMMGDAISQQVKRVFRVFHVG